MQKVHNHAVQCMLLSLRKKKKPLAVNICQVQHKRNTKKAAKSGLGERRNYCAFVQCELYAFILILGL